MFLIAPPLPASTWMALLADRVQALQEDPERAAQLSSSPPSPWPVQLQVGHLVQYRHDFSRNPNNLTNTEIVSYFQGLPSARLYLGLFFFFYSVYTYLLRPVEAKSVNGISGMGAGGSGGYIFLECDTCVRGSHNTVDTYPPGPREWLAWALSIPVWILCKLCWYNSCAAEVTGLGFFFCFVVINPRVLSANRVDLGFFCFINFLQFTPPPQTIPSYSCSALNGQYSAENGAAGWIVKRPFKAFGGRGLSVDSFSIVSILIKKKGVSALVWSNYKNPYNWLFITNKSHYQHTKPSIISIQNLALSAYKTYNALSAYKTYNALSAYKTYNALLAYKTYNAADGARSPRIGSVVARPPRTESS